MLALNLQCNPEFRWRGKKHVEHAESFPSRGVQVLPAGNLPDRGEIGFGVREWKDRMVDHQEILSAVAVAKHGPSASDIQEFDRQTTGGSDAVLLDRAVRV